MTPEKYRRYMRVAKALDKAQVLADEFDLTLGNGGLVGSLIGSMAEDLRQIVREHKDAD